MITVENLCFAYPGASLPTLRGLDFCIDDGEIFGFLGPSGAGKSTTQNILIKLLAGYQGKVEVLGKGLSSWGRDYYEQVGVSFELPNHYLKLTARENLDHFASLYKGPKHKPEDVLEWVGLAKEADKRVAGFSKGMKIRLNVARSIIHQPSLIFLDEPTSGLDPVNAEKIRQLILRLREEGATVFVTTHNMDLADSLCDRLAFIASGKIAAMGAPAELKKQYGRRVLRVAFRSETGELCKEQFPMDNSLGSNASFQTLIAHGDCIETMHSDEASLEKIFAKVTGQALAA